MSLSGKTLFITGASRGIGREIALKAAANGTNIVVAAKSAEAHAKLPGTIFSVAEEIVAAGGKALPLQLDVRDEDAVKVAMARAAEHFGGIDALINNAGILYREAIVDTPTELFRKTVETDLIAQFVVAREVGRHMLARKKGRIVNISSVMAILGRSSVAGYVAAKHGVVGLTKTLAAEFGPDVTVNAIAPGYIRTEINVALQKNKDFNSMLETRTAARRWGRPADLRGALLLLASDAGAYITGHTLVVDGGLTTILA